MSPAQAMLWQVWRGWRWSLALDATYLLVAAVVVRLLPAILVHTTVGIAALPEAGQHLAMPTALIVLHLMTVFSLLGADDLKDRGYSPKMFALPVRSRTLVIWPMLWGCLSIAFVWLIIAGLILRPTGIAAPLWWPAAALAAGSTLLQALTWTPLAQSWLRIFLAVPVFMGLVGGTMLVAVLEVPEPIAAGIFLALLPLTFAASLHGVAMARRGDAYDWQAWNRMVAWMAQRRKPADHPFASAAQAQFWFEWRSFGWTLPMFVGALLLASAIVVIPTYSAYSLLDGQKGASRIWMLAIMLVVMPAAIAAAIGTQLGDASFPFVAIRPIAGVALVRSKFTMALASAAVSYIPILLILPLLLLPPGVLDSLAQAARTAGPWKTTVVLMLVAAGPFALTWKGLVESQWLGLIGRPWLSNTLALGLAVLIGCSALLGVWIVAHPELQAVLRWLVPWLLGLLVILKLCTATWVLSALLHNHLISPAAAAGQVGLWSGLVLTLVLIAYWLVPSDYVSLSDLISILILFVPFSRLAGAPLALAWNRHR